MAKVAIGKGSLTINLPPVPAKAGTKLEAQQKDINARLAKANAAETLLGMFEACGVELWGKSFAAEAATTVLLNRLLDIGLINRAVYDVLWHALQGHPDASAINSLDAWSLPTLQKAADWDSPNVLRKSLDAVAALDPKAADFLATVILQRQASFSKEHGYHASLAAALADAFWRGAKVVVPAVLDPLSGVLVPVAVVAVSVVVLVVFLRMKG